MKIVYTKSGAYRIYDGTLFHAPIDARGEPDWEQMTEVDFDRIEDEQKRFCRAIEDELLLEDYE